MAASVCAKVMFLPVIQHSVGITIGITISITTVDYEHRPSLLVLTIIIISI